MGQVNQAQISVEAGQILSGGPGEVGLEMEQNGDVQSQEASGEGKAR